MRRRTYAAPAPLPLPGSIIDTLLVGASLHPVEVRERGIDDDWYDAWAPVLGDYGPDQMRAAWVTHRAALMAEWKRRGGEGLPWAVREYEAAGAA